MRTWPNWPEEAAGNDDGPIFDMFDVGKPMFDDRSSTDRASRYADRIGDASKAAQSRFTECLFQSDYWITWDGGQFHRIQICEMDREHAKNAVKWLLRHAKRARAQVMRTELPFFVSAKISFGQFTPKQFVKWLPVYQALRARISTPPNQAFSRAELRYLASGITKMSDDDRNPVRDRDIATKARDYLDLDY